MYENLVQVIFWATLSGLSFSIFDLPIHDPVQLASLLAKQSRIVTKIDWKPISVFPEEARRFEEKGKIEK